MLVAGRFTLSISLLSYTGGHNTASQFWSSGLRLPKYLENPGHLDQDSPLTVIPSLCMATTKEWKAARTWLRKDPNLVLMRSSLQLLS